jgi:mannosyltransferase OCH1-like enzyme
MIPKKVHISWNDKSVLKNDHPLIKNGLFRLSEMNADWQIEINDDDDIDHYLENVLTAEEYSLIENVHIVEKSDIWRLFKIFNEGGLYIDIDRLCNVKLNELIDKNTLWVLPICRNWDFSQDFMMSAPNNLVFLKTIEMSLQRRREGNNNTYYLGAQTYMHSITGMLFGEIINTNPGEKVFEKIREQIWLNHPTIKVYQEDPPYKTVIYKHDGSDLNHEMIKRDFYKQSGLKHWTGEW